MPTNRDFIYWHYPQVQYHNPDTQLIAYSNRFPTPFIQCHLTDGRSVLFDVFNQDRQTIHERVKAIVGKSRETLDAEAQAKRKVANPANFGKGFPRHCICEVTTQVPCPGVVMFPPAARGKFHENHFDLSSPLVEDE